MTALKKYFPVIAFTGIAILLLTSNAFPSLYGDEYGSLSESAELGSNLHAIGYFLQLRAWRLISEQDIFLRLLSVLQFSLGVYVLYTWMDEDFKSESTKRLALWLLILNPFIWEYGTQIRFYPLFFSSSIFFAWRLQRSVTQHSRKNFLLLVFSSILFLTSHILSFLAVATLLLHVAWGKIQSKKWKIILAVIFLIGAMLIFLPGTRTFIVNALMDITNAKSTGGVSRGISMGMLAKIPLNFYFFTLGERVYPLWWWVSIPAMLVMGTALLLGVWKLRELGAMGSLSLFMLLNIPFLYLILDPLAPPGLQGAAPRYVIFTLPYFLILLAHGAQTWKPLQPALILVSLAGMYCLTFPTWSYGAEFVNWEKMLAQAVTSPQDACIITDGRANGAVERYHPANVKAAYQGGLADCKGFKRIVLVSNDYRLSMVRYFDTISTELSNEYNLVSNTTLFPAQVTVYERNSDESSQLPSSRLDLPEQDLRFPITSPNFDRKIQGFVRLDAERPKFTIPLTQENLSDLWILTNYRSDLPAVNGTPIFRLLFSDSNGNNREVILRAGIETAAWDGSCDSCKSVYQWTKRVHLLGTYSYPGAYRQYKSNIWGFPLADSINIKEFNSVNITFLLPEGTGYFYGIFPQIK